MISKILIANRGEIAIRVMRSCRELSIATVAVFSDVDADAYHVRTADQAYHIGPSPSVQSYLVGERIIEAAKATGADAIHPGYGFLAENARFAQMVLDNDLIWIGPPPSAVELMGAYPFLVICPPHLVEGIGDFFLRKGVHDDVTDHVRNDTKHDVPDE